ncbi:MAG: lactonase family protein [Bryobacterales bacterium]|nr:lactonase family protein [Bryobacterales bacterium]
MAARNESGTGQTSRRRFLIQSSTALTSGAALTARAGTQGKQVIAYVGAGANKGKGIHMFHQNPADGSLTPWKNLTDVRSPGSLVFHPNKKFLYATTSGRSRGDRMGTVTAMAVAPDGDLRVLNVAPCGGSGPAHIGIHPTGRYVFTANYGDGTIGMVPVKDDGSVGDPTDVQRIEKKDLGSQPAKNAPPGSFAISGHDAPHAHMAFCDPTGKFVLLSDLATDRIYVYQVDVANGKLKPGQFPWVQAANGDGPRHFTFSRDAKFVYSLNEEGSTVDCMTWNASSGELKIIQTLSTLPKGFEGTNYPSVIMISADGKFLYCANRLYDSVALFALNQSDGRMRAVNHYWTHGAYPRHFNMDPAGSFFYVLHSNSDNITVFKVNKKNGALTFANKWYGVGSPAHIEFLAI